jgi:hypothetical protein
MLQQGCCGAHASSTRGAARRGGQNWARVGADLGEGRRLARQHGYVGYGEAAGRHVNAGGRSADWYFGRERRCCPWWRRNN